MTSAAFYASELAALMASMPGPTSSTTARADWYDRQPALLERAVADGATNAADATKLAATARRRAARLREGRPS